MQSKTIPLSSMHKSDRMSWDEYALALAWVASLRSEDPYRKVGACALDFNNRVLGVAYNGLQSGIDVSQEFWNNRDHRRPFMIHAEANLLSLFKRGECKTIALTCMPCSSCSTLIASNMVKRVVYMDHYETDSKGLDILGFYQIHLVRIPREQVLAHLINS